MVGNVERVSHITVPIIALRSRKKNPREKCVILNTVKKKKLSSFLRVVVRRIRRRRSSIAHSGIGGGGARNAGLQFVMSAR